MNEYDRLYRQAQRYKELYPKGTRILLLHMGNDPRPVEDDMRGTVIAVDDVFSVPGALQCNPLHLASKVVGKAFPLTPLKGQILTAFRVFIRHEIRSSLPSGKNQNHCTPCFTERMPSSAFAFFAVLSLTPASFR